MGFSSAMILAMATMLGTANGLDFKAPRHVKGSDDLYLDVGSGVVVRGNSRLGKFMCSDEARCVFQVPQNEAVEMVAIAPAGRRLLWNGCTRQPAADRCTVAASANPRHVTVR